MNRTDERTSSRPPYPYPEVRGHGLRLCSWDAESDADVQAWFRGRNDPEFRRWNTPMVRDDSLDGARASLRKRAEADAAGETVTFRAVDAESGATLGQVGFSGIDTFMRRAMVGYWVLPEARGRRVATRSLDLAARWGFTEFGLYRIELDHALGHDASCRVAERCGFPYEGVLRGAMFAEGRRDAFRDAHLHARLATDPEPTGIAQPTGIS
ncbi:GNAT family N-acetyltransferase [Streptomyces ipomoeae]|jgi:RimJ/RimL family protein N-acetyltransferase|uniref:Acetyltransferase, GNAT family n=1 Tax=Streptomyces ipomoeae 91-03 TaxID=698759 RepID=L1KU19_9ACTN|nr:GNAT family N-acetyltransferase [Streptomyces ipomoeae]EKX64276.1 acetyltransferase, GNAT family [Streptomyces ipomoeae 91-03]MDX2694270.1 GNAT family N-acetyltransferase [Streptomyces ipomoeae]MDX2825195.1 GNAT family N-acetyltransferase [Streptomyces ipomoeae]MDX2839566.1 GNAT family N-acetyltransferase [Streptomyces ipomoeae]MDX2877068.1 GNAT family N-acetyltransferase [Streptomyces ipomoeae]